MTIGNAIGCLEVHGRYESCKSILPSSQPAVVLVVAESVDEVADNTDGDENVEHWPADCS